MITMKIGGSSLKSLESLDQVAELIISEPDDQKIVIVSAVHGVTDHLIKSTGEALETDRKIAGLLDYLQVLHHELILGCIKSMVYRRKILDETDYILSRLEKLLYGIAYTGECTCRTRDLVVSMGERLAVQLVAGCLLDKNQQAVALDADQIDIIATGDYGYGNADLNAISERLPNHLNPFLRTGTIPVITGFFGRTTDHRVITFGRGGTDYSAAVVAYAMSCDELQIWKDVDGFMTADPKMAANVKPLLHLSYDEAAELSYFGAKILHPRSVEPLAKKNIPAVIKNTFKPSLRGSVIGPERQQHEQIIKSVTFNHEIGALRLIGPSLGYQIGFLKRVISALTNANINIISVITAQTAVNLLLNKRDVVKSEEIIASLEISYVDEIEPILHASLVGVVGEGLAETKGLAARAFKALAMADVNVEMIVSGASRVATYFIINQNDVKTAVCAIHNEFFGQDHVRQPDSLLQD